MTIAIYYRVSTDLQNIEHQRHAVNLWIEKQGYDKSKIVEFVDEGISGAVGIEGRAGFSALVESIKRREIARCIMFETSRASRDFMVYLNFLELCARHECIIEIVGAGVQGFTTSTEQFLAAVQGFINAQEREKISARVKSGIARVRAEGKPWGGPKGHSHNRGWTKHYTQALIDAIVKYTEKGYSLSQMTEMLADRFTKKAISRATVYNLQKKYCRKEAQ